MFNSNATTKLITFSMVAGLASFATSAQAEGGDWGPGSGGDMCVERIKEIRDDIHKWINRGGSANLDFAKVADPENGKSKPDHYNAVMTAAFAKAGIECVDETLYINEDTDNPIPRTCVNQVNPETNAQRIRCTRSDFKNLKSEVDGAEQQYRLVHHEYAGLAGIEANKLLPNGEVDEDSSMILSGQLGAFLEEVTVKRLAVKAPNSIGDYWTEFQACDERDLEVATKEIMMKSIVKENVLTGCKSQHLVDDSVGTKFIVRRKITMLFSSIAPVDGREHLGTIVYYDTDITVQSRPYPTMRYRTGWEASSPWYEFYGISNLSMGNTKEEDERIMTFGVRPENGLAQRAEAAGFVVRTGR